MKKYSTYPIGSPGIKWATAEKTAWLNKQSVKRSYQDDVVSQLKPLANTFHVEQYGALSYDSARYPLFLIKTRNWQSNKPTVLVTGGVHGYETSGVHGALQFTQTEAAHYADYFNIVVAPCISPWGYETINRWTPQAIDPNRSFLEGTSVEESAYLMQAIANLNTDLIMHIDLHETTDTDNSEFLPARAARDGTDLEIWAIPDGFYLVGNSKNPAPEFQKTIINHVEHVTHIAPTDENKRIIGVPITQRGVINYDVQSLGLCAGITNAQFSTTTEVYPDSPLVTDALCTRAQVAAITGGLDYILTSSSP